MHSTSYEQFELPQALCAKPLALVGVSGLDIKNNAIHKSIWETFSSNRRVERAPVLFRLLSNAHEFPVVKPKRNSYEWYIPKGILKRNWMNKHLNEIPAVIVVFYDLDWNDVHWNEKMIECASRVQSLRAALESCNTRITVVLIQNTLPLPAGEDVLATERAVTLCASCELNAKSLFVLPHGDHLQGYAVRLENAFYDLAQNYYHTETRNVKSHREHLNKNTHQYLFVRHQFKMGFLNELKQDSHTAHKHYTHAYNNLLEIRIVDTNAMEIRTVAGFINYKLCRLMFTLSLPRDAISQFRAHTDRFKVRLGFQELAFEHYAWISKQFTVFGDIFDEAVKLGLPAVQTQHPGIYYQQAAQYAISRKKCCTDLCSNVNSYPSPDPLEGFENMEFYGQRPWRPGKLSAEPPDPQLESNGIQALQYLEKQVNHSNLIISSYGLAISQYKTYRCPRMRRHLVVQMADEYYNSHDYGKALTLFTHMLWDYRPERWWSLLSDIFKKSLRCAYLTANVQDYILLSLEILSSSSTVSTEHKISVYENFSRILKRGMPQPEPDLPPDAKNAEPLWRAITGSGNPIGMTLDMSNIVCCIECKTRFTRNSYQADQNASVELYVRSTCPFALSFTRISITINTPGYSSEFAVDVAQAANPNLLFNRHEIKRFLIEFVPDPSDIGKDIQVGSVNLQLGTAKDCCIDLKFTGMSSVTNSICPELNHFRNSPKNMPDFGNIPPCPSAVIVPRNSKLGVKLEHSAPALVGEWYKIKVVVINNELYPIKDLQFEISLIEDDVLDDTMEFSLNSSGKPETLPLNIKLGNMKVSDESATKLYVRGHKLGERNIKLSIVYILESEKPVASVKEEIIHVPFAKPFDVSTKFLTTMFEEVSKFYAEEAFVVMPVISCSSPWPIVIENTTLDFSALVRNVDENISSQVAGLHLQNGESSTEVYLVETSKHTDQPIHLGQYSIRWKRVKGLPATSQLAITGLPVDWLPLDVNVILPAHGYVRTPMLVDYHLHNRSHQLIQLDISMETGEGFMFAGYKQLQISVLPESTKVMQYNLYPLISGSVALPKLNITIPENSTEGPSLRQEQINLLLNRALPTHLFVMPQMKGNPRMADIAKFTTTAVA